ncbi:MAG: NDP-sugar synthase, partial [Erysipelotrichaceae bacterium]
MNYSINIMATGNNCVIICPEINKKMFPFTETLSCLLPIGNSNTLSIILDKITKDEFDEIIIIGSANSGLEAIAEKYEVKFLEKKENYIEQIYSNTNMQGNTLIIKGNLLISEKDYCGINDNLKGEESAVLIDILDRYDKSNSEFGVKAEDKIFSIYGHPREHYVNGKILGAFIIHGNDMNYFKTCMKGFHNVNCGQMPDNHYYIEEVIQNAIEANCYFKSIWSDTKSTMINFPWDISKGNELFCMSLNSMNKNTLGENFEMDETCCLRGYLESGNNVVIRNNVIFEGNCSIGSNVRIEAGVIIGKNVIIKDNTTIQYHSRIIDNTVIGSNNKIGYNAEIKGVTFDGVCAVHGCEISGVIGQKVDIAAGVLMAILRFDDELVTQRIDNKNYANPYTNNIFIGNYCRTGVGNIFLRGVKIGN